MSPELRVFISSTFQDMQAEREQLMKHVFPEIRQRCRERGVVFTEIDLRWGLTREEGTQGRIIRTCLEEIDKCRPFFLGILGERYGWVPSAADIERDPELMREFPWIADEVRRGASLIDLEFAHGALRNPDAAGDAYFYVKSIDAPSPNALTDESQSKLAVLRQRVERSPLPVRSYGSVDELGTRVREDMLAVIDRRWPDAARTSPVAAARRGHEAFASARRRAYYPHPATVARLDEHASGRDVPLMVVAESGLGKSALLAYWANEFRLRHPEAFVIEHYVGTTPGGAAHAEVLRRILDEINEHEAWDEQIPTKPDELEAALPLWLARLDRPLVLVIDALNQLDAHSHSLQWLPSFVPPHVRLVVSAIPGPIADAARERGWGILELAPLGVEERATLAATFLEEYRKRLSADQSARIAGDPKCASPLFLRTVLEELRLFGRFEELDAQIEWYLNSTDTADLFQRVLRRMEDDFGESTLREIMSLIWTARAGLSEEELIGAAGLTRVECSRLLLAMDYHLMQRDRQRTFFHDYLRRAVEARYLAGAAPRRAMHGRLGEYFAATPPSERRADEEPWQWRNAEAWERLKSSLIDPALLPFFDTDIRRQEGAQYWLALEPHYDARTEYARSLEAAHRGGDTDAGWARIAAGVARFMQTRGDYEYATELLTNALNVYDDELPGEKREIATILDALCEVRYATGDVDTAEHFARAALMAYESFESRQSTEVIRCESNLGTMLFARGDLKGARDRFEECLARNRGADSAQRAQKALDLNNLASICQQMGDLERATEVMGQAIAIARVEPGVKVSDYATYQSNMGLFAKQRGLPEEASQWFSRAFETVSNALGQNHPGVADILYNHANVKREQGKLLEALSFYERAEAIRATVYGPTNIAVGFVAGARAGTLRLLERYDEAEEIYLRIIPLFETALGVHHPQTQFARERHAQLITSRAEVRGSRE